MSQHMLRLSIVQIGQNTNKNDILCPDLGMEWDDTSDIDRSGLRSVIRAI